MPNTNAFTLEEINQILEQLNAHPGARLQYIGSRYVPIFGRKGESSIEWDNTGTYEPLTIVLYQGNSYTSRQFVPAGIEIANGEYWAETGNYNAQIEQYRQEVLQYKTIIEETVIPAVNDITIEYCKCYDTVAEMKADSDIQADMTVHTNGFNSRGDGGTAFYVITNTGTANETDVIACQNGLFANLIVGNSITLEMFGAYGDGSNNDTGAVNAAISYAVENDVAIKACGNKKYLVDEININGAIRADFSNSVILASNTAVNVITWANGESTDSTYDPYLFGGYIKNLRIDGNNTAQDGLYLLRGKRQYINNIEVFNCVTGYRISSANESNLDTIRFFNCETGIENTSYDTQLNNVYGRFSKIGIHNTGALNLNTGHIWVDEEHGFNGSVGILTSGRNNINSFYFDSYETAIKVENSIYSIYLTNCKFVFGFENSTCFDLTNDLNNGATIYIVNSFIDTADYVSSYKLTTCDQSVAKLKYLNSRVTNAESFNPLDNLTITTSEYIQNTTLKAFKDQYMVGLYGSAEIVQEIPANTSTAILTIDGISLEPVTPVQQFAYPIYLSDGPYGNPGNSAMGAASLSNNGAYSCSVNVSLTSTGDVGKYLRFAIMYPCRS